MITAAANAVPLDQERWLALIASRSEFVVPEPVVGTNPFTGKPSEFRPHPASARVVLDGIDVGSMHWAMDSSSAVIVWANEDTFVSRITAFALEVAEPLGGVLLPPEAMR